MLIRSLFFILFSIFGTLTSISAQQICVSPKITDNQGNEDPFISCDYPLVGECLNLKVWYPEFRSTSTYEVSSTNFTPYGEFNAGTPLKANADDLFLKKIVMPFNFCYFGNNFNEIVVGSNGVLTFDSTQLGNVDYPNVQTQNPSPLLLANSIFGVNEDLVFSDKNDSEIYYSFTGIAPCRKLIINYYKGRVVGCSETSTSQVVLSEGSNQIEIFVKDKPLACGNAKFKNALLGIINADGTKGYSPAARNTGVWEAKNEAWKFTPSGDAITPEISWFDSAGVNVAAGESVKICPKQNEIYTVKVKYPMCGDLNVVLEDQSSVSFAPDYPLAKDYTKIFCGNLSVNVDLSNYLPDLTPQLASNLKFSFHNSLKEAESNENAQDYKFQLSANRKMFVRVQNISDPNCFRTAVLNLNLIAKSLLNDKAVICDINNDNVEKNFDLSKLDSQFFTLPISGSIKYYKSRSDAVNSVNEIKTADLTANSQFYINYVTADCSQTFGPVSVSFNSSPVITTPLNYKMTTCDFKDNKEEPFDFLGTFGQDLTTDPNVKISFFSTYDLAFTGSGSQIFTIKDGKYQVFARVEDANACFSIGTINLDITFTRVEAVDKSIYICFDGKQDLNVDLDDYAGEMLIKPLTNIKRTYFNDTPSAEADENEISNLYSVTEDGDLVSKVVFVKFTDSTGCYALKQLNINLVHVVIKENNFEVCDFSNDGTENTGLEQFSIKIKGGQNAEVLYFKTLVDAQKNENAITTFQVQNTAKLFVRITSYNCSDVFEISLKLAATPSVQSEINVVRNSVCDNNADGQELIDLTKLQGEFYTGSGTPIVQFYRTFNSINNSLSGLIETPEAFSVAGISLVYAKTMLVKDGCYSVTKINLTLNFLPAINLKTSSLQKCDYDFNLNETFNLKEAIPLLFAQENNILQLNDLEVYFYPTSAEANAGLVSARLPFNFVAVNSDIEVFARFTSKTTDCYSVMTLLLQTYLPPKALNSTIGNICDDNLDGSYDVNLTLYTSGMVYKTDVTNKFTFFHSEADATENKNPILEPEKFSANPLPAKLYVRVENIPGCFDIATVDFNLGTKITLANNGPLTVTNTCDFGNDGEENIDLTQFEGEIFKGAATYDYYLSVKDLNAGLNKIQNAKAYFYKKSSGIDQIYIKVSSADFCPEMVVINLSLKDTPIFKMDDVFYFCPDGSVDIKPDFAGLDISKFEWKNAAGKIVSTKSEFLNVKEEGNYNITVTSANGCTFTKKFTVKKYEVPVITELIPNGTSYTVIATGSKTILYSVDGINFQISNVFNNLPAGVVTFYVKFADRDCLGEIKKGLMLDVKNSFSPNGDGVNDTWIIDDIFVFEGKNATIKVFDHNQKLLFEQESNSKLEWDGKTNTRNIFTGNYWYLLTLPDGRTFNGWVLLKNRN